MKSIIMYWITFVCPRKIVPAKGAHYAASGNPVNRMINRSHEGDSRSPDIQDHKRYCLKNTKRTRVPGQMWMRLFIARIPQQNISENILTLPKNYLLFITAENIRRSIRHENDKTILIHKYRIRKSCLKTNIFKILFA